MPEKIAITFVAGSPRVEVRLAQEAFITIRDQAIASREETGGILIGRYEGDGNTAVVTVASTRSTDSSSGRAWFQRGVVGLKELLRTRWTRGEYYLGEWHSHPGGSPDPSGPDLREMRAVSRDVSYRCPRPILIIAGISSGFAVTLSASVLADDRLLKLRQSRSSEGQTSSSSRSDTGKVTSLGES